MEQIHFYIPNIISKKMFNKLYDSICDSFEQLKYSLSLDYPDFYCVFTNDPYSENKEENGIQ